MQDDGSSTAAGRAMDRRTVLGGAAGTLLGATLVGVPRARAGTGFDPALAARLQQALDGAVAGSKGAIPGTILYVERTGRGSWTGTSGLGRLEPATAMRPGDRFPVGSVVKPFVSATVLQLVERGRLTLDAPLPAVLPADVVDRFPTGADVTVRMLLGHRSGLPDWSTPATNAAAARDPARIWKVSEFLDLVTAKKPAFAPGTRYAYSNTNYTVLGLVLEHVTGRSWRRAVTEGVLRPLRLAGTALPPPGNRTLGGPHAHGYMAVNGKVVDATDTDPSMAGAAGGHALVTTAPDLVRFFDALLAGRLFRRRETLQAMTTFAPARAPDEPGQVGYGLGLFRRIFPGGIETIDHLGGAGGYFAYVARLQRQQVTFAAMQNGGEDPSPLLLPVLQTLGSLRG